MTTLGLFGRVSKTLPRLAACGETEEVSAILDAALCTAAIPRPIEFLLREIQNDLSHLRTALSTPPEAENPQTAPVSPAEVARLEAARRENHTERADSANAAARNTHPAAGLLRMAGMVTRRAERSVWALLADAPNETSQLPARYLNRLSDLLLDLAARLERDTHDEIPIGLCYGAPAHPAAPRA